MTIITTNRFILRPIVESDAPVFARLCNDELIARNTARIPHPYTLEDAHRFVRFAADAALSGKEFPFAVTRDDEIIGCAGVMAKDEPGVYEMGYWVGAEARGNGVATESGAAVTAFAFDQRGAARVVAGYFIDNPTSGRVLVKIGFTPTGEVDRQFSLGRGGDADCVQMTLARGDFIAPAGVSYSVD
ncbi:MAG: GNAT family N-acetyltransferase [Parvularculaceae bacterium]